jgi:hypothetical protein
VIERGCQREPFQALVHIGITSLWVLPVMAAPPALQVLFALLSAGLHIWLSERFYYEWVMSRPGIDGGPLGFLTWCLPVIAGSLAYDIYQKRGPRYTFMPLLFLGVILMALGYGLACLNLVTPPNEGIARADPENFLVESPFVPPDEPVNMWTMSQRAGSISYQAFGAGFSLALYALFVLACDCGDNRLGLFRTLGTNALAAYILHGMVARAIRPYAPPDAPVWFAMSSFGVFVVICYGFLRYMERRGIYLRL